MIGRKGMLRGKVDLGVMERGLSRRAFYIGAELRLQGDGVVQLQCVDVLWAVILRVVVLEDGQRMRRRWVRTGPLAWVVRN